MNPRIKKKFVAQKLNLFKHSHQPGAHGFFGKSLRREFRRDSRPNGPHPAVRRLRRSGLNHEPPDIFIVRTHSPRSLWKPVVPDILNNFFLERVVACKDRAKTQCKIIFAFRAKCRRLLSRRKLHGPLLPDERGLSTERDIHHAEKGRSNYSDSGHEGPSPPQAFF